MSLVRATRGWFPPVPPRLADAAVVAVVFALELGLFRENRPTASTAALLAYAAAGATPLWWRRTRPGIVFALAWTHSVGAELLPALRFHPTVGLLVALYAVLTRRGRSAGTLAVTAVAASHALTTVLDVRRAEPDRRTGLLIASVLVALVAIGGVWAVARWARHHTDTVARLAREREIAARQAAAAERSRLARDLHDIVAHAVTVMVLQAAGARRIIDAQPDRAANSLGQIEDVGKQAMSELRRLLTVLRAEEPAGGKADAPHHADDAIRPGLAQLDDLLYGVRCAGVAVHVEEEGTPVRPDPSVGLTAYRVVQEALTNVTKHAGPGTYARIRLGWAPDLLTVEVTDDGAGEPPANGPLSTGHGLVGLRERVAMLGGRLVAGREPGRGFAVRVTLPLGNPDNAAAAEAAGGILSRPAGWEGGRDGDPGTHRR